MIALLGYLSIVLIALLAGYHRRRLKMEAAYASGKTMVALSGPGLLYALYTLCIAATGMLLVISCMYNLISYLSLIIALCCILMDITITLVCRRRAMRFQAAATAPANTLPDWMKEEFSEQRYSRYRFITSGLALVYMAVAILLSPELCRL
jgi:hypothetical protein